MSEQLSNEVSNKEFGAIALYGFMGWLTSRQQISGPFSANHNAMQAADLVQQFCESQSWEIKTENWINLLKDYPR